MKLDNRTLPEAVVKVWDKPPVAYESGFLYFRIQPWSQDAPVYIKVRSRSTIRAMRQWLRRIADWSNVGLVTHLKEVA